MTHNVQQYSEIYFNSGNHVGRIGQSQIEVETSLRQVALLPILHCDVTFSVTKHVFFMEVL